MRRVLLLLWASEAGLFGGGYPDGWERDYGLALERARAEGRCVYLAFTGSDWSVASKRWIEEILENEAFAELAEEALVLVSADYPRRPQPDKKATARHQALVITHDIKDYPTLILIGPEGRELLRHGHLEVTPAEYVAALKTLMVEKGGEE